jgi:hypothetical protein
MTASGTIYICTNPHPATFPHQITEQLRLSFSHRRLLNRPGRHLIHNLPTVLALPSRVQQERNPPQLDMQVENWDKWH